MKKIILIATVLLLSYGAFAQIEVPVKWSYAAKRVSRTEAIVYFRANIQSGWHIYSLHVKDGGPIKTSFKFAPSKEYGMYGKTTEPTPLTKYEKAFSMDVSYFEKTVTFQQKIKLRSPKAAIVKGSLEYMTCNDKKCLPPDDVEFSVPIGK